MLEEDSNHTCSLCSTTQAEVYCCCQFSPIFLCSSDYAEHAGKKGLHQPIPIWTFPLMPEYYDRLVARNEAVRLGTVELRENMRTVENCIGEFEAWIAVLTAKIEQIQVETKQRLEAIQRTLAAEIAEGLLEEAQTHYEDSPVLRSLVATRLRNYTPGSLTFFTYRLASLEELYRSIAAGLSVTLEQPEEDAEISISVPKPAVPISDISAMSATYPAIAVFPTKLFTFDIYASHWKPTLSLSDKIEVDNFSAAVCINESSVFVCGGNSGNSQGKQAYLIVDGAICRVSDMDLGRNGPGVVYIPEQTEVMVFGGSVRGQRTKRCISLSLQTLNWREIGEMTEGRALFNPCRVAHFVYLCGGYSRTVDLFDPQITQFRLLKTFSLPSDFAVQNCTSVYDPIQDCIVSISKHILTRWDVSLRKQPQSTVHRAYEPWSRAYPVVLRSQVLLVDMWSRVCMAVDLANGAILSQVAIPEG